MKHQTGKRLTASQVHCIARTLYRPNSGGDIWFGVTSNWRWLFGLPIALMRRTVVFNELSVGLSFKVASVRVRLIEVGYTHAAQSEAFNRDPLESDLGYGSTEKSLPRGSRSNSPKISLLPREV